MSVYPGGYDAFPTHFDSDGTTREIIRAADINALGDAITAIQNQLGLLPPGSTTVAAAIAGSGFFRYTQGTPDTTWTITHNLGGYPAVTIVDSAGSVVIGDVTYTSATEVVVQFSAAFGGEAFLS